MNRRIKSIITIIGVLSICCFMFGKVVNAVETMDEWNEAMSMVGDSSYGLDHYRGTESWDKTIGYANVSVTGGTSEVANAMNAIGDGGIIFNTTGSHNYTPVESLDTTGVEDSITGTFSPEVTEFLNNNNLTLEFNYYERNDKSNSEWIDATGGVYGDNIAQFYGGDETANMTESQLKSYIEQVATNHPTNELFQDYSKIEAKNDTIYTSVITTDEKGNFIIPLVDGNSNGVYAGDSIVAVDSLGNIVAIITFDEYGQPTFETGDAEDLLRQELDKKKNEEDPDEDEPDEDVPGRNHVWCSQSSSITPYKDMTPNVTSRIFNNNPYDVEKSIPTSERLIYELSAKKAFHDIEVRRQTASAGARDITIQVYAQWTWYEDKYEVVDTETEKKWGVIGEDELTGHKLYGWIEKKKNIWGWVRYWHTSSTNVRTVDTNYAYSTSVTGYDVPKSIITPLTNGMLYSMKGIYQFESGLINLKGMTGPEPQTLSVWSRLPSVSQTVCVCIGTYSSESAAYSAVNSSDGGEAKGVVIAAVNSSVGISGSVNYSYGEGANTLVVTTSSCNYVSPEVSNSIGRVHTTQAEINDFKNNFNAYKASTEHLLNKRLEFVKSSADIADNPVNIQLIPSNSPNGTYESFGEVYYGNGAITITTENFTLKPNPVVIHTPVINNSGVTDRSDFINQKVTKVSENASNLYYLMLDEQFTITLSRQGTHKSATDYPGYGTRVYNSYQGYYRNQPTTWGKIKDVKFPFDVYVHYGNAADNKKFFLPANTWLSSGSLPAGFSCNAQSYTFTLPVWVTEGKHTIQTRVIAENTNEDWYKNNASTWESYAEEDANLNISNYVATKTFEVEVIGKIYDLRINASNDPGWQQVYSHATKKEYITANEFPFGQPGHNRVTQYKYASKLGYTFVFNFKTKGRKSNNIDISIQPQGFYFVSSNGGRAQEVDLYYNSTTQKNIKIQTADTIGSVSVRLTDAFMEVPSQELVDSNRIYPQASEIGKAYNYNLAVKVGNFARMNLPHSLRLCYNNFVEYIKALYGINATETSISANAGSRDKVIGSVGHWYAGYRLPASTMAVPKGGNIQDAIRNNTLLKDGYILVKFDIITKSPKNNTEDPTTGEVGNNYLKYLGPEALNGAGKETGVLDPNLDWTKDNFPIEKQTIKLPNGKTADVPVGTVAIFEGNLRSSNDAEVGGTH